MWVFPGQFNVFDNGYANIDTLFIIAPWVFMFLIPAVSMRMFADEKKSGTIELLYTRPITEMQIIFAKYLACLLLVFISLLPTLVYFFTVYFLGNPTGNMDIAGTTGSYIGLFFLGSAYSAIGLFASSLTENQIVSFIISLFLCFFCYIGFESVSALNIKGQLANFITSLGINAHYISMSRGVIDTRDVIYFISLIAVFLLLTRTVLESRKW
jgi:ABC-2 type transport system permease protein